MLILITIIHVIVCLFLIGVVLLQSGKAADLAGAFGGLGPMLALELAEPTPDLAKAVTTTAREKGLILLSCGLYGNVIRILVPLVVGDEDLERGFELVEESLVAASASA